MGLLYLFTLIKETGSQLRLSGIRPPQNVGILLVSNFGHLGE